MAVAATCYIVENTFVSTRGPEDMENEEAARPRRSSWPDASGRSLGYELLGYGMTFKETQFLEGREKEEDEPEMKSRIFSTSTFDGENFDSVAMSSESSPRNMRIATTEVRSMFQPPTAEEACHKEQEQEQEQEEPKNDSESSEAKGSSTKLKPSAQRPSKTTRVKCKAVAQRAIDAAMETGSPDAIQVLINLAGQTPYMRSLLRHALEHFDVILPEK